MGKMTLRDANSRVSDQSEAEKPSLPFVPPSSTLSPGSPCGSGL